MSMSNFIHKCTKSVTFTTQHSMAEGQHTESNQPLKKRRGLRSLYCHDTASTVTFIVGQKKNRYLAVGELVSLHSEICMSCLPVREVDSLPSMTPILHIVT